MTAQLKRRLEKLEERLKQELASKVRMRVYWLDPKTGIRTYFDT